MIGTKIDSRASESREEDTERNAGCSKTTTSTDISSTSEGQILLYCVGVDLANKDLEEWRQRAELLSETGCGTPESTFCQLLDHEGHERDEEDDEDGDDTTIYPIQNWREVGVDELNVFTAVEYDSVILIVGLSITKNWVSRQLDTEFGTTHTILHDLRVTINQSRVETRLFTFDQWSFFVQIGNLKIRISTEQELGVLHLLLLELGITLHRYNELEFATCHAFQLALEFVGVTTKHLNNFRVLNTVEQLDSTTVVHESRDGTIEGL